jgi:hypothetical protein
VEIFGNIVGKLYGISLELDKLRLEPHSKNNFIKIKAVYGLM